MKIEEDIAQSTDEKINSMIPDLNILFLPYISASLPKGTRHTASASRYAVAIQLKRTASTWSSFPIAGRAILTEEAIKGVIKELSVTMIRADLFSAASSAFIALLPLILTGV